MPINILLLADSAIDLDVGHFIGLIINGIERIMNWRISLTDHLRLDSIFRKCLVQSLRTLLWHWLKVHLCILLLIYWYYVGDNGMYLLSSFVAGDTSSVEEVDEKLLINFRRCFKWKIDSKSDFRTKRPSNVRCTIGF